YGVAEDSIGSSTPKTLNINGSGEEMKLETTDESGGIAMPEKLNSSMIIPYVILGMGVVAVLLLVWFIWGVMKKRKTSGSKDIEGQTDDNAAIDSTENPDENNTDSDRIQEPEQDDRN
ncbi:unnamed protein product, partial [Meganyctiphanes norvegica]